MTVQRAVLWIVMNAATVLLVVASFFVWPLLVGTATEFTGPATSGRGGLLPVGTLLRCVLIALLVVNLAWAAFVVRRR
jgi:hypothetical protein